MRLFTYAWIMISLSACTDIDGDGQGDCPTIDDTCEPPIPAPDLHYSDPGAGLALGGKTTFIATSRSGNTIQLSSSPHFSIDVTSSEPGRIEAVVTGAAAGTGSITIATSLESETVHRDVAPIDRLEMTFGTVTLPTHAPDVFVLASIESLADRTVVAAMRASDDRWLEDESLKLAPTSAPEVTKTNSTDVSLDLLLPTVPGTYSVVFEGSAIGQQTRPMTIVDHVDSLTGQRVDGDANAGTVCFYGVIDNLLAVGPHWTIHGAGARIESQYPANCVAYANAVQGAQLEVVFAGVTTTFDIATL